MTGMTQIGSDYKRRLNNGKRILTDGSDPCCCSCLEDNCFGEPCKASITTPKSVSVTVLDSSRSELINVPVEVPIAGTSNCRANCTYQADKTFHVETSPGVFEDRTYTYQWSAIRRYEADTDGCNPVTDDCKYYAVYEIHITGPGGFDLYLASQYDTGGNTRDYTMNPCRTRTLHSDEGNEEVEQGRANFRANCCAPKYLLLTKRWGANVHFPKHFYCPECDPDPNVTRDYLGVMVRVSDSPLRYEAHTCTPVRVAADGILGNGCTLDNVIIRVPTDDDVANYSGLTPPLDKSHMLMEWFADGETDPFWIGRHVPDGQTNRGAAIYGRIDGCDQQAGYEACQADPPTSGSCYAWPDHCCPPVDEIWAIELCPEACSDQPPCTPCSACGGDDCEDTPTPQMSDTRYFTPGTKLRITVGDFSCVTDDSQNHIYTVNSFVVDLPFRPDQPCGRGVIMCTGDVEWVAPNCSGFGCRESCGCPDCDCPCLDDCAPGLIPNPETGDITDCGYCSGDPPEWTPKDFEWDVCQAQVDISRDANGVYAFVQLELLKFGFDGKIYLDDCCSGGQGDLQIHYTVGLNLRCVGHPDPDLTIPVTLEVLPP